MTDKIKMGIFELSDLIQTSTKEEVNQLLSSFSCVKNPDVQNFLNQRAISNDVRQFAKTYLVVNQYEPRDIIGFFSFNISSFSIINDVSNSSHKYVTGFKDGHETFPTLLLCQFGRADRYKGIVPGDELLTIFLSLAKDINSRTYIRTVSVEYDADNTFLDDFYSMDASSYEKKYGRAKLYHFRKIQLNKKPKGDQFLAALRLS
ncbi:hypothetical protein [Sporolactobacillus sp. THM19-2]|uniref:hypothetical protein n=1 Tax=Sporolactobacillus sp. THM19-2 TaxID=2511171 RepID=UPI001021871F|nr:hypothetical protein [Sporolactobacillus sp. THM19-2]RYL93654.1 hypothetical protein EWH91_04195 [Sporolactobacillus sp. THM19-2]